MAMKIQTPHRYAERILLFGGAGVGKTNSVLDVLSYVAEGDFHIIDADYSGSYERAIYSDFEDVADRAHVHLCSPEWFEFIETLQDTVNTANQDVDWLVIDPLNNSYDWVQNWVLEQVHGGDLTRMLIDLRRTYPDDRDYARARSNLMNWELVKKEYAKVWKIIQKWKGHLIIVAEAKAINDRDGDDIKQLYGPIGFYPAGQAAIRHVASTNLFLAHPKKNQWTATTVKDRNREEQDRMTIDSFALDYLVGVAGWGAAPPTTPRRRSAPDSKGAGKTARVGKKVTLAEVAETVTDDAEGADDE